MREKVLITGGTGMIGSNVARSALDKGLHPVLFDYAPNLDNISGILDKVSVISGDIGNLNDILGIFKDHDIKYIVHLAASLTISSTVKPTNSIITNCVGTSNIVTVAKFFGCKRTICTSSAAVYGPRPYYEAQLGRHVVTEDDLPKPFDLYGSMKYLCEGLVEQARREELDIVALRPVMTFGYGRLTGGVGILNKAMRDALLTGRGVVTRPWLADTMMNPMYAKDGGEVFVRTLLHEKELKRSVYNLGTGEYLSLRQMMDLAEKSLSANQHIDFEDAPPREGGGMDTPSFNYPDLDSSALREEIAWQPAYSYEAAAAECIDLYREEAAG